MWAKKFYFFNLLRNFKTPLVLPENSYAKYVKSQMKVRAKAIRKIALEDAEKNKKDKPPRIPRQKFTELVHPLATLQKVNSSIESAQLSKFITKNLPFHCVRLLPAKFLRIQKTLSQTICIAEETTARDITTILKKENLDPGSITIEINPAFGLLTRKLVHELKLKNLTGFEEISIFYTRLVEEFEKVKEVNFLQYSFINIPRTYYQDRVDNLVTNNAESRLGKMFANVYNRGEKPIIADTLYVIGPTPKINVINFFARCFAMKAFLFEENLPFKKAVFYLIVSAPVKETLTATPESNYFLYRAITVIFNMFFDYEVLGEFPRKDFLPWDRFIDIETSSLHLKKKKRSRSFGEKVYLFKFSKKDTIEKELGSEHLFSFWFFSRHHFKSRNNRIIPLLETWVPGCGELYIRKGLTIYTTFGSKEPHEIYEIYKDFVRMPQFAESAYPNAVEKYLSKIEAFGDLDDSDEKKRSKRKKHDLKMERDKVSEIKQDSQDVPSPQTNDAEISTKT